MGEFEFLARLRERLPPPGPGVALGSGDDAAITAPAGATATSIDSIVEDVHFRRETAPLRSIGHKALASALSDLAAMGAQPGEAYVAIGVPPDLDEAECLEMLDGLLAVAGETGTTLAGGDIVRSNVLFLTVAVVGHAANPEAFVRRGGARPGDSLIVTGEMGGASAGLLLLQQPSYADRVPGPIAEALRKRQLEPDPRFAAGAALAGAGATAMIDISDGLGADATHLAEASGVKIVIDGDEVPRAAGVDELARSIVVEPADFVLTGGEDYELLATVPPERVDDSLETLSAAGPVGTVIGFVAEGAGVEVRRGGVARPSSAGFDHLA